MRPSPSHGTSATRSDEIPRALVYHELSKEHSRDVYQLHPEVFATHLRAIQAALPADRFKITFDDAHWSQVELATPILDRAGLQGIFFAPAAWISARTGTATWNQLRALSTSGHIIGSHGRTHTLLTRCTPAELKQELIGSRKMLEDGLGVRVTAISMPGGRWNVAVAAACLAAGYRELYTSAPGRLSEWISGDSEFPLAVMGRLCVRRAMTLRSVVGYARSDWLVTAQLQMEYKAKQVLKLALGDAAYQKIWRRMLRSPREAA